MSDQTIHDRIKELLCNEVLVGFSPNEIKNDTGLIDELHLDSIQMMGLIAGLENEFAIEFEDDDLDLQIITTVNALANFVSNKT